MSARNRKRLIDAELAKCKLRLADPSLSAEEREEQQIRREKLLDRLQVILWEEVGL